MLCGKDTPGGAGVYFEDEESAASDGHAREELDGAQMGQEVRISWFIDYIDCYIIIIILLYPVRTISTT
jgi:hypothetical protein